MDILVIKDLSVTFQTSSGLVRAVEDVTLELKQEETLALVGETGCGKSTIALSILNLLPEYARIQGKILYDNQNLLLLHEKEMARLRGKEISLVMQNPGLALNPVYSIGHQIIEPLMVHKRLGRNESRLIAEDLLEKLHFKGPSNALRAYPFEMSGGMKQRVLIGISVILNPKVFIADEPTKALDSRLCDLVLEELGLAKEINRSSLLMITHDLNSAWNISDRIAVMYAGEILETGKTRDFFEEPLHPYSVALLRSLPDRGFIPIPGVSPSMIHRPKGCKFHPRCQVKREICSQQRPHVSRINDREVKCVLYS